MLGLNKERFYDEILYLFLQQLQLCREVSKTNAFKSLHWFGTTSGIQPHAFNWVGISDRILVSSESQGIKNVSGIAVKILGSQNLKPFLKQTNKPGLTNMEILGVAAKFLQTGTLNLEWIQQMNIMYAYTCSGIENTLYHAALNLWRDLEELSISLMCQ